jgi:hypothetical protein
MGQAGGGEEKRSSNYYNKFNEHNKKYNVFNTCDIWPDEYYQKIQRMSHLYKLRNWSDASEEQPKYSKPTKPLYSGHQKPKRGS